MEISRKYSHERIEEIESEPMLILEAQDYLRLFYREQLLSEAQLQKHLKNKIYIRFNTDCAATPKT